MGWKTIHRHCPHWDYERSQVYLSIPAYIPKALKVFQHTARTNQHQPFPSAPIKYGTKTQYATQTSTAPLLDDAGKKFIQQVCGKFLFLGRVVDATLLCPISAIASQSATPLKIIWLIQSNVSIMSPPKKNQCSHTTPVI